ncbi:PepSY-like domain-containing protein [Corallococcus sp. EGB]|uniref:PepSY-like domain-containing protein n=1 Tax=Corallococcus sp. EGB TaxID=1521117 RepID=UPI001CBEFC3E|nr:PepSY-like domain-containing protein [Corallococcus sp. EGB]
MKTWKAAVMGALMTMGLGGPAMAKDAELPHAQIPGAVRDALASKYPQAKAQRFTKETKQGKTVYEVDLTSSAGMLEVNLAEDGTVLSEEQTLDAQALPAAVRAGLAASSFGSARVKKAEKERKNGTIRYEVIVEQNGGTSELVFDEQGKLLKSHAEEADEGVEHHREGKNNGHEEEVDSFHSSR